MKHFNLDLEKIREQQCKCTDFHNNKIKSWVLNNWPKSLLTLDKQRRVKRRSISKGELFFWCPNIFMFLVLVNWLARLLHPIPYNAIWIFWNQIEEEKLISQSGLRHPSKVLAGLRLYQSEQTESPELIRVLGIMHSEHVVYTVLSPSSPILPRSFYVRPIWCKEYRYKSKKSAVLTFCWRGQTTLDLHVTLYVHCTLTALLLSL